MAFEVEKMIDWVEFWIWTLRDMLLTVGGGAIGFFISMYLFNKYYLPKMAPQMGKDMIKALKELPEVQNLVKRANGLMDQFEPLLEKVKNVDSEKVEEAVKALTELAGNVAKKLEKPEIPEPD